MTIDMIVADRSSTLSSMPIGYSDEARIVKQEKIQSLRRLQNSHSLGLLASGILEDLDSLSWECQNDGWDGQGAAPIRPESLELARKFLMVLPLGIGAPALGAEPDGEVTIEWYRSSRYILSISFGPNGDLHYASFLGPRRAYGTEPFFGTVPKAILDLIWQVRSSPRADAA